MPTVQQLAAAANRQVVDGLARALRAMPADKQTWQPLDAGRSALNQVQECAVVNPMTAQALRERAMPHFDRAILGQQMQALDTMEKALAALETSVEELAAAIEAFPDEHLDDTIMLPIGGGMEMTFARLMLLPYWNMTYHVGQVNYIQTLYGDKEMH